MNRSSRILRAANAPPGVAPEVSFLAYKVLDASGGGLDSTIIAGIERAADPNGLVANAVTIETETLLTARHTALGGDLVRIALSRASAVGGETAWRPAMPITQWVWTKP